MNQLHRCIRKGIEIFHSTPCPLCPRPPTPPFTGHIHPLYSFIVPLWHIHTSTQICSILSLRGGGLSRKYDVLALSRGLLTWVKGNENYQDTARADSNFIKNQITRRLLSMIRGNFFCYVILYYKNSFFFLFYASHILGDHAGTFFILSYGTCNFLSDPNTIYSKQK